MLNYFCFCIIEISGVIQCMTDTMEASRNIPQNILPSILEVLRFVISVEFNEHFIEDTLIKKETDRSRVKSLSLHLYLN